MKVVSGVITGRTKREVLSEFRDRASRWNPGSVAPDPHTNDQTLVDKLKYDDGTHDWYLEYHRQLSLTREFVWLLTTLGVLVSVWLLAMKYCA